MFSEISNAIKPVGDYTKDFIANLFKEKYEYYTDNPRYSLDLSLPSKAMHVCFMDLDASNV